MSYAQRNNYNQGFNRNSSFSYGNNQNQSYGQPRPRKRSGAKFTLKDGIMFVSAWKKNKYGFFKLYGRPYKGTKEHIGKTTGKRFLNYFVTITNMSTGQIQNVSGLFYPEDTKLRIPDLNQVVSRKGQGGYYGKSISKNYNG